MPLNNSLRDCQAHADAFILALAVESLERFEDSLQVSFIDAYPIILDKDLSSTFLLPSMYPDHRFYVGTPEFDSIVDEVLEQLPQLVGISFYGR